MFWSDPPRHDRTRHLRAIPSVMADPDVRVPDGWADLLESASLATRAESSPAGIETIAGWGRNFPAISFQEFVSRSLREWRINPGRSPLRGMDCILGAVEGRPLFSGPLQQSLFLKSLLEMDLLTGADLRVVVKDDGRETLAGGVPRLVVVGEGAGKVDVVVSALLLWQKAARRRVEIGEVRLPKKLYRGIRLKTIPTDHGVPPPGVDRHEWSMHVTTGRLKALVDRPLRETQAVGTLSFAERRVAAESFARSEGVVVDVDPRDLEIVSSWSLEEALAGPDGLTGRSEREWIARVPEDYVLAPEAVDVRDVDYAMLTGDASRIDLIHHNQRGRYRIGENLVEAAFFYSGSGVGGQVRYRMDDGYFQGRRKFASLHGFDPLPAPGTAVEDVRFFSRDDILGTVSPDLPRMQPLNLVAYVRALEECGPDEEASESAVPARP